MKIEQLSNSCQSDFLEVDKNQTFFFTELLASMKNETKKYLENQIIKFSGDYSLF